MRDASNFLKFHPTQVLEEIDDELIILLHSSNCLMLKRLVQVPPRATKQIVVSRIYLFTGDMEINQRQSLTEEGRRYDRHIISPPPLLLKMSITAY